MVIPFSEKQLEYLQNATHRWNIKEGATRSGKTFLDVSAVIAKRIMNCTGNGIIVLLGNTEATLERNILSEMRKIWGRGLVGNISTKANMVNLFGKTCYALGASTIAQVSRLQGTGIEYAYGDEITTWHPDMFSMLKSRLDKPNSCFDGTCNPDNPRHWAKTFLDSGADLYRQTYTIDDNPFNDPAFVENLKNEYRGTVYYDRFILGLWVAAEGVIYKLFADKPDRYIIKEVPPIQFSTIGVDFGGNGSAHTFSCTGFRPMMKGIVTLEEYYEKNKDISPADLENKFVAFVRMCMAKNYGRAFDVYVDSAEQTLKKGLEIAAQKAGLPVNVRNARKGEINERIRFLNRMLATDRYHIMKHCEYTIDALQTAVWSAKSLTKDVRLDDGTTNIDSLDAMEYTFEPFMRDLLNIR